MRRNLPDVSLHHLELPGMPVHPLEVQQQQGRDREMIAEPLVDGMHVSHAEKRGTGYPTASFCDNSKSKTVSWAAVVKIVANISGTTDSANKEVNSGAETATSGNAGASNSQEMTGIAVGDLMPPTPTGNLLAGEKIVRQSRTTFNLLTQAVRRETTVFCSEWVAFRRDNRPC